MNPVHQNAILLGGVNYSESSRVIWLLTPEFGRQSLLVKGARRPRSKYLGNLETFNLVRVIYRKGERSTLFTLREIDVLDHFGGIRKSLDAFWAASEAVELVKAVSEEEQESQALFELLRTFLTVADKYNKDTGALKLFLLAFRWRLVSILGMAPRLVECLRCHRKPSRAPSYRFLLVEGGILCPDCGKEAPASEQGYNLLSYQALRFVYRSTKSFPSSADRLLRLESGEFEQLEGLTTRYLSYHLGDHPAFRAESKS